MTVSSTEIFEFLCEYQNIFKKSMRWNIDRLFNWLETEPMFSDEICKEFEELARFTLACDVVSYLDCSFEEAICVIEDIDLKFYLDLEEISAKL